MAKLLIIAAVLAIAALAVAAPVEKKRIPFYQLLRRDPFPEPKFQPITPSNISLLTVEQRVDNFNPQNLDTWEQRYYQNSEFYTPGSPIFLFLGGEWVITEYRLTNSLMYDMADDLNANILYLEHRYYGESRPTPNVTDENLRFLTPEQALGTDCTLQFGGCTLITADTANFVNHIRTTLPGAANSPFILVGGHYSASLAVWFRQRYPHLSAGVWASSAPLPSIVDYQLFKEATGFAFRTVGGDACYDALDLGFDRVQDMVDAGQWDELTETFFLCDPLEPQDLAHFFSLMAEFYAILPQFEFEGFISATCDLIIGEESSVESIAFILNNFIDIVGGECIDIDYESIIEAERQTDWDAPAIVVGYRQWAYTLCSQIGWFHTSGSPNQPFGNQFPVEVYHVGCAVVFGDGFTEDRLNLNSNRFNTLYGGMEPNVSNAVFVYGQHDPWSWIGRRTNLSDDATAIVIPGATMGNDLGPRHVDNSPALRDTKDRIEVIIRGWIDEFYGVSN